MKIAVISAYNPRNAGMYSVDLAAQRFLAGTGHAHRTFRMLHGRKGPFFLNAQRQYRIKDLKPLEGYDVILYWGDFLNNPVYGLDDFHKRESYYSKKPQDVSASFETWKSLFLLEGFEKGSRKVYSISNNFQSSGLALASLESDARNNVIGLMDRFDGIYPRDPASTIEVENLLGDTRSAHVETGVDAAVLNRHIGARRDDRRRETFTWFFHRSGLSPAEQIQLVETIANATGLRPVNLRHWLSLNYLTWDWRFSRMVSEMKSSAFCLSDTYHCLINAMTQDTPVIGVGRGAQMQHGTLGDYKKKQLFSMFDLNNYYIEIDQDRLSDDNVTDVLRLAKSLSTNGGPPALYETLDNKASNYRNLLSSILR